MGHQEAVLLEEAPVMRLEVLDRAADHGDIAARADVAVASAGGRAIVEIALDDRRVVHRGVHTVAYADDHLVGMRSVDAIDDLMTSAVQAGHPRPLAGVSISGENQIRQAPIRRSEREKRGAVALGHRGSAGAIRSDQTWTRRAHAHLTPAAVGRA